MRRKILPLLSAALFFYSNAFSQDDIRVVPFQEDILVNSLDGRQVLFHHRYIAENLERLTLISENVNVSSVTRYLLSKSEIGHIGLNSLEFKDKTTVQTSDSSSVVYSLELKL